MIDFHTHILPNMDDGSDSVDTSIKLLNNLKNDGVKLVCLTSHFYPRNESIDDFLKRRAHSFCKLDYKDLDIRQGSEVHYYRGISQSDNLDKLCIEKTNILLIELSTSYEINEFVINELLTLQNKGYKVLLAHIERYKIAKDTLIYMHNNGILFQVNTEVFLPLFGSKKYLKMLKNGYIDALGSDCHDLKQRNVNYGKAMAKIENKLGKQFRNFST